MRAHIGVVISQAMPGATMLALPVLGQVVLLCYSGWSVVYGRTDLGTFVVFASFLAVLIGSTRVLASFLVIAQRTQASVKRVSALIDTRLQMEDGTESINSQVVGLELENMSFNYHHDDRHTLSNASFPLRAGETVAVVGISGSGKSTPLTLPARFYDPCPGKIQLNTSEDRQSLHDIRLEVLRRRVGIVFENAFLFTGTVAENIAYSHPQIMANDIRRAVAAAGASDSINALPKGFSSPLTKRGTNSSSGQRRRIVLARALITVPDVLILDDTTSVVDAIAKAEINTALGRCTDEGRMLLVIT